LPLKRVPDEVARRTFQEFASTDSYARLHFEALKRLLAGADPDYTT
jgi:hypothetical protein